MALAGMTDMGIGSMADMRGMSAGAAQDPQADLRGMPGQDHDPYKLAPSPEDMEREMQAVQYNKKVLLEAVHAENFDLSDKRQTAAYKETLKNLFNGTQARSHIITCFERKFVEQPKARWIVHVEWFEYKLVVKPNEVVGQVGAKKKKE